MKRIIFLKLGGSLITDKTKPFTPQQDVIAKLAIQIKLALNEDPDLRLIIGNGAGSYGHYTAQQYKIKDRITAPEQLFGFCVLQDSVARLNRIIVANLIKVGVCAIGVHGSSMMISHGGKIKQFATASVEGFIDLGIVPIIYGDVIVDSKYKMTIFSTEQILKELAFKFVKQDRSIDKVIHNGITKGVFDNQGKVIKSITASSWSGIKKYMYDAKGFDVTGGMQHKVNESMLLAKKGIPSLIINGISEKNLLKRALLGMQVTGTVIS